MGNVFKDLTKGSEDPGSRSFLRILIGIWSPLRIWQKDLDPFWQISIQIQILYSAHMLYMGFHFEAFSKEIARGPYDFIFSAVKLNLWPILLHKLVFSAFEIWVLGKVCT